MGIWLPKRARCAFSRLLATRAVTFSAAALRLSGPCSPRTNTRLARYATPRRKGAEAPSSPAPSAEGAMLKLRVFRLMWSMGALRREQVGSIVGGLVDCCFRLSPIGAD